MSLKHFALAAILASGLTACPAAIEQPISGSPSTGTPISGSPSTGTPEAAIGTVAPTVRTTSSGGASVKIKPADTVNGPKLDASSIDLDPSKTGQQLAFTDTGGKGLFNLEKSTGTVTFTPNAGLSGEARAEYTINTLAGQTLKPAMITVLIAAPVMTPKPVTPTPVTPTPVTPTPVTPSITAPIKVLFIGNSRTRYFDIPNQVKQLASSEARKLETRMVAFDGWTLEAHWNSPNSAALQAIREGGWNYVVLQELSSRPVLENAQFVASVKNFNTEIKKIGARTVLYENWWRKDLTYSQAQLNSAYKTVANDTGAAISPVGTAWLESSSTNPSSSLFDADGNHATALGAYLAACEFYAFFYEKTPKGLPNLGVSGNTTAVQTTAWQTFTKLEGRYHGFTPAL